MTKSAEQIKAARVKANMTTKQLAKKCGLTANYIDQLESGIKIISESIAAKIFKVLDISADSLTQESMARKEERTVPRPKVKTVTRVTHTDVEHTACWTGALDNLIRKYPIYSIKTQKSVGDKSLPTLEKKIDGFNCDKLSFIQVNDDEMTDLGIVNEDILTVYLSKDITNDKIYYYEIENKHYVRRLRKEQNNKIRISKDHSNDYEKVDISKVKIIGRCVKIERKI